MKKEYDRTAESIILMKSGLLDISFQPAAGISNPAYISGKREYGEEKEGQKLCHYVDFSFPLQEVTETLAHGERKNEFRITVTLRSFRGDACIASTFSSVACTVEAAEKTLQHFLWVAAHPIYADGKSGFQWNLDGSQILIEEAGREMKVYHHGHFQKIEDAPSDYSWILGAHPAILHPEEYPEKMRPAYLGEK